MKLQIRFGGEFEQDSNFLLFYILIDCLFTKQDANFFYDSTIYYSNQISVDYFMTFLKHVIQNLVIYSVLNLF